MYCATSQNGNDGEPELSITPSTTRRSTLSDGITRRTAVPYGARSATPAATEADAPGADDSPGTAACETDACGDPAIGAVAVGEVGAEVGDEHAAPRIIR